MKLLKENQLALTMLAHRVFDAFVSMPKNIRPDEKERTGAHIVVTHQDEFLFVPVYLPSDRAIHYSHEKLVRAGINQHCSSQNTRDIKKKQFAGMLGIAGFKGDAFSYVLQVSTSGLKEPEDVAMDIIFIAWFYNMSTSATKKMVASFGAELPEEFDDPNHYINRIFARYDDGEFV